MGIPGSGYAFLRESAEPGDCNNTGGCLHTHVLLLASGEQSELETSKRFEAADERLRKRKERGKNGAKKKL